MDKKEIYRFGLGFFPDNKEREEKEFLEFVSADLQNQKPRVLEVGVGTGRFISIIRNHFAQAACYGIDVVPDFVQSPQDGIHLSLQSAENLSFESDFFDVVFCIDALHHVPDRERALAEIARVAKPNGLVLFRDIRPRHVFDKLFYRLVDLSCFAYNSNAPKYFSANEWQTVLSKHRISIETIRRFDSELDWIACRKK